MSRVIEKSLLKSFGLEFPLRERMAASVTDIPSYALWGLLLVLVSAGVTHLLRVRREKRNESMKAKDEEKKACEELLTFVSSLLAEIDASSDLRKTWQDSLPRLKALVEAYVAASRRQVIAAEFSAYESIAPTSLFRLTTFDVLDRASKSRMEAKKAANKKLLRAHLERIESLAKG